MWDDILKTCIREELLWQRQYELSSGPLNVGMLVGRRRMCRLSKQGG